MRRSFDANSSFESPAHEQRICGAGEIGDVAMADRALQDADRAIAERELVAAAVGGKRDVAAFIGFVGRIRRAGPTRSDVDEVDLCSPTLRPRRCGADRAGVVAVPALDRQVHLVRRRVDGEIIDRDVAHCGTEVRGHALVDVFEIEGLRADGSPPSPRSIAWIVADALSATKSTPSGPKVIGPAERARRSRAANQCAHDDPPSCGRPGTPRHLRNSCARSPGRREPTAWT